MTRPAKMPRICSPGSPEESSNLTRRLAKAVLQFQDSFMALRVHSGSLCQVRPAVSPSRVDRALVCPSWARTSNLGPSLPYRQACSDLEALQVWLCDQVEGNTAPLIRTKVGGS